MTRDQKLIDGMERAAARMLPKPPGFIIPGWFWAEWAVLFACLGLLALIGYGISFL